MWRGQVALHGDLKQKKDNRMDQTCTHSIFFVRLLAIPQQQRTNVAMVDHGSLLTIQISLYSQGTDIIR